MPVPDVSTHLSKETIRTRVYELAKQINADYAGRDLVLMPVLTGGFVFAADLLRHLDATQSVHIEVVRVGRRLHAGERNAPNFALAGPMAYSGTPVLIVDDAMQTGKTLLGIVAELKRRSAAEVEAAVLIQKCGSVLYEPKYIGFADQPAEEYVGYGMDYEGKFRNLAHVCIARSM